jgi:CheY-like chemotaxis protein
MASSAIGRLMSPAPEFRDGCVKSILLDEMRSAGSTTPLRLLILENETQDVELTLLELRASGLAVEVIIAQDREQFLAALQGGRFDAVLADYRLPSWSGLEALKELRASGKDVPFLLVTGTSSARKRPSNASNKDRTTAYSKIIWCVFRRH